MPIGVEPPLKKNKASREDALVIFTKVIKVLGSLPTDEEKRLRLVPRKSSADPPPLGANAATSTWMPRLTRFETYAPVLPSIPPDPEGGSKVTISNLKADPHA